MPNTPPQLWRIHEHGPNNGRPILLLHGWLGAGPNWLPLVHNLNKSNEQYRWLLPDIPGHGPKPWGLDVVTDWRFDTLIESLLSTLRTSYKLESCDVMGYSMGGRLALYLATSKAQFVRSLLLESCQPGIIEATERSTRAALDDERAAKMQQVGLRAFVERWYEAPLFASLRARPDLLAKVIESRQAHEVEGVAAALTALSPGRQPPLWSALSSLHMPVTLVTGEEDTKYTSIVTKMASLVPHAQLHIIPNAGHNVHIETPDTWRHIVDVHLGKEREGLSVS